MGDSYKTYGTGTNSVAAMVKTSLADEGAQSKNGIEVTKPFVMEDKLYRHLIGRRPGDTKLLAEKVVQAVDVSSN